MTKSESIMETVKYESEKHKKIINSEETTFNDDLNSEKINFEVIEQQFS
jgi:hypothetical protein